VPKLVLAVACETIITEQDGVASLIRLFNTLRAFVDPNSSIPENAVAPKEWAFFSIWEGFPEDEGLEFVQRCEVLYPNGSPYPVLADYSFVFLPGQRQQNAGKVIGFPIGQQGNYKLRIWLEREGQAVASSEPMIIGVEHVKPEVP
jgi:hypothetical protein